MLVLQVVETVSRGGVRMAMKHVVLEKLTRLKNSNGNIRQICSKSAGSDYSTSVCSQGAWSPTISISCKNV